MPRLCRLDPHFEALVTAQDCVVHRRQAVAAGMTSDALHYRLGARRQPALLYAGPHSAIDGIDACHFYGIKAIRPDDALVHVVVPATSQLRSTHWLVVRRTSRPYSIRTTALLRYVHPAAA